MLGRFLGGGASDRSDEVGYALMEMKQDEESVAEHAMSKPLKMEVENMSYYVRSEKGRSEKKIMHGISLSFLPGEMCALMGSSGAGKTTLLNVLSSRASGRVSGRVLLNGDAASSRIFKTLANYVPQEDEMLTSLTPRQQLDYATRLRCRDTGRLEREQGVAQLLEQMRLTECADVQIVANGGEGKGISGGQRKRVSIAMELVNEPSALLLDEPTSGLDSEMAFECVSSLRTLTRERKLNVICTIHQPSRDVFLDFDELVLLARGRLVYHGSPSRALDYIAQSSLSTEQTNTQKFAAWENPADLVVRALTRCDPIEAAEAWASNEESWHGEERAAALERWAHHVDEGDRLPDIVEDLASGFKGDSHSSWWQRMLPDGHRLRRLRREAILDALDTSSSTSSSASVASTSSAALNSYFDEDHTHSSDLYAISRLEQFFILAQRAATDHFRAKFKIQMGVALGVGTLYGLVFRNLANTQDQYDMRLSALFMAIIYNGMMCVAQASILVPLEKRVLLREYQNGYYAVAPYFVSAIGTRFFFQAIASTVWSIPFTLMTGLSPSFSSFFLLLAAVYNLALIGLLFGFTIGTLARAPQQAQQLMIPCIMPLIIFCGFLLQYDGVQWFFLPLWYFSFFRYAFTILVVNEFRDGTFEACHPLQGDYCPLATFKPLQSKVDRKLVITKILDFPMAAIPDYFFVLLLYTAALSTFAYYILRYQARRRYG